MRVRRKNATGMVCTWSNTARRRSRISPSPIRDDHTRVTTAVTASATPIAAIAAANNTIVRTGPPATIRSTTRPASSGVATASTAPTIDVARKTRICLRLGRANTAIRRIFSRVNTPRSHFTGSPSERIIARIAACCIVTGGTTAPNPARIPAPTSGVSPLVDKIAFRV